MKQPFRSIFTICGLLLGIPLTSWLIGIGALSFLPEHNNLIDYGVICIFLGLIFFAIFPLAARGMKEMTASIEKSVENVRMSDLAIAVIGMILGLLLAMLISTAYSRIPNDWVSLILTVPTYLVLGYLGFMIPYRRRGEISSLISNRLAKNREAHEKSQEAKDTSAKKTLKKKEYAVPKLLDTSVIIDGRISDIVKTGFLEGPLIVPVYVLNELQLISDSSDDLKRGKGRRGLDIVNQMQDEDTTKIVILDEDFDEIHEVDAKLIKMAKAKGWKILTNDFNLNKVATVQGVTVLNINDLANAVKSLVLPGEHIKIQLIKSGKEHDQAVGYLEDGTMIVVENGKSRIGDEVQVVVTSVLQTSAGRMIFARLGDTQVHPSRSKKRTA